MVWILTKYVLTAAIRDRLLLGFLLILFVGMSLSVFLGSSAITEKDQFSLIFAASGLRIGGNITLILFTVFYLRRAFESRDIEYLLSRPITKLQFLTAHFLAFSILALLTSLLITVALMAMPSASGEPSFLFWWVSFWVELNIMVVIGLFFSLVLSSAVTAALCSFAFYLLGRLIGDILGIIEVSNHLGVFQIMEKVMLIISVFVPRFDLMGQSVWLLYGAEGDINLSFILTQGFVFCGLVFGAALLDLKKRQF